MHFVREAFKHAKPLAAFGEEFLLASGVLVSGAPRPPGISSNGDPAALASSFLADISVHRHGQRNDDAMAA